MSAQQAAILLSRQSLRPCCTTPWVRATVAAIERVQTQGMTLLTSVGMQTWELVLSAASSAAIPQRIFIPAADREEFEQRIREVSSSFRLDRNSADFAPVLPPIPQFKRKALMALRDRAVIEQADVLIPISIRKGGLMEELLGRYGADKTIIDEYAIPYEPCDTPLKYTVAPRDLNPGLYELDSDYLIHWTRTSNGPWPDELPRDFYRAVLEYDHYPRTARSTLLHILNGRRVCASSRHMPTNVKAVSFSALPPADVIPLMRWRARYAEMSFEPYGIGIRKDRALERGIREVRYYDPTRDAPPAPAERWRCQSTGHRTDWRREAEYRARDDVNLAEFDNEDLLVFCHTPAEAAEIVVSTGLATMSIRARD